MLGSRAYCHWRLCSLTSDGVEPKIELEKASVRTLQPQAFPSDIVSMRVVTLPLA
jgi:hypothetical protein